MNKLKAYGVISTLIIFTWITLILTIKSIDVIIELVPNSLLRSIVGLLLYGLWGLIILLSIKSILDRLSKTISSKHSPP